jgi:cation transport ATPase
MNVPTNPVHVLDLSFFLPAVIITGVLLLKRRPLGYTLATAFMAFLTLTGIPILITPIVQARRGETAGWGVLLPIGTLTAVLLYLLMWLLSTVRDPKRPR